MTWMYSLVTKTETDQASQNEQLVTKHCARRNIKLSWVEFMIGIQTFMDKEQQEQLAKELKARASSIVIYQEKSAFKKLEQCCNTIDGNYGAAFAHINGMKSGFF
uniref:Uncharacterized protein n=1 Tax=Romanomermis culicivorax TaxID=13658 RepID=A0A915HRR1_ROMCU